MSPKPVSAADEQGGWTVTEVSCMASGGPLYTDGCALSDQLGRDAVSYDKGVPLHLRVFHSGGIRMLRLHGDFVVDFSASFTLVADHRKLPERDELWDDPEDLAHE